MKIFHAVMAGTVLFSGAAFAKEVTHTLEMSGWHCGGCGNKTASAIMKLKESKSDPSISATADAKTNTIKVTFDDSKVNKTDIEEAVKTTKYKIVGWK